MHEILRPLTDLGLTPINALLVAALWVVWRVMQAKDAQQNVEREKAHAATATLVEKIEKKQAECETDRARLSRDLATMALELNAYPRCPAPTCPVRDRLKTPHP